jgi:hypothetical protein
MAVSEPKVSSFSIQYLQPPSRRQPKIAWADVESEEARKKENKKIFQHFGVHKDGGLQLLDEAEVSRQRG